MHSKTIVGLLVTITLGGSLAMLFRQSPGGDAAASASPSGPSTAAKVRPRGQIVPLPAEDLHAQTAFLSARRARESERSSAASANKRPSVSSLPTIRRQRSVPTRPVQPTLQHSFPTPWAMLGLDGLAHGTEGGRTRAPRLHTIVDGDTLSDLAARYLGGSHRAAEIFEANRGLLASPELLPIGAEIVIPAQ